MAAPAFNYTHLHVYKCSFCKAVATNPILVKSIYRCAACLRLLTYIDSVPIETEEQRQRAEKGLVFSTLTPEGPGVRTHRCSVRGCLERRTELEMIREPGIGWFCSEAHRAEGMQEWEAFKARCRAVDEAMPWLKKQTQQQYEKSKAFREKAAKES